MYINYHHLYFADHKYAVFIRLTNVYISISNINSTAPRTRNIFRSADVFLKMYKEYDGKIIKKEKNRKKEEI